MKLWDILKAVGSGIVREVVPGGGLLVDTVNGFLPDGQKLPKNASGDDVDTAIAKLPPEQQAGVLDKEFDVDIARIQEKHATVRAMLEHDANNPQSTRPQIALGSFWVVAFVTVVSVLAWVYGVITGQADIVQAVQEGWPLLLAGVAPLVTVLHRYFGAIRNEHRQRMAAATGQPQRPLLGELLAALRRR